MLYLFAREIVLERVIMLLVMPFKLSLPKLSSGGPDNAHSNISLILKDKCFKDTMSIFSSIAINVNCING